MSPRSSRDGVRFDVTFSIECIHCGLVAQTPQYDVVAEARRHFEFMHPKSRRPREGREYTSYPSPNRCDTCNAVVELPYWRHISDPPTNVPPIIDNDGKWLVCDTCHGLVAARDLIGLVRRSWANLAAQSPGMAHLETEVKANSTLRFRLLFENWDEGTRISLVTPPPSPGPGG